MHLDRDPEATEEILVDVLTTPETTRALLSQILAAEEMPYPAAAEIIKTQGFDYFTHEEQIEICIEWHKNCLRTYRSYEIRHYPERFRIR